MAGTLHGFLLSPNCARALIVARELGLDVKVNPVNSFAGEAKTETFLSLNPFGKVPAFETADGLKIFESRAIARYHDVTHGGKLLRINNPKEYALVEAWINIETTAFAKNCGLIASELLSKPLFLKVPTDQAVLDTNKAELLKLLAVYEKHLASAKTTYLLGDEVSLADLFHVPYFGLVFKRALPDFLAPFPHVTTWVNTLLQRPSVVSVQKDIGAALAALGISL